VLGPLVAIGLIVATSPADAARNEPRIMVMPIEGDAAGVRRLPDKLLETLRETARRFTPHVEVATASLADTAVIVGCDPAERACLDAVAAALNVDRLLFARIEPGTATTARVEVTLSSREHGPVSASFDVRGDRRDDDLDALAAGVVTLFEQDEDLVAEPPPDEPPPDEPPPPADPVPVPGPPIATDEAAPRARWPLYVAGGGTGVVAVGVTMWALAASKQGEIDDAPTETAADLERLADLEASARTRATAGNLLVVGGAIAIVGGVGYYLFGGGESSTTVGAAPVAGGGAAVSLGGVW
jgi:hypothetical protein